MQEPHEAFSAAAFGFGRLTSCRWPPDEPGATDCDGRDDLDTVLGSADSGGLNDFNTVLGVADPCGRDDFHPCVPDICRRNDFDVFGVHCRSDPVPAAEPNNRLSSGGVGIDIPLLCNKQQKTSDLCYRNALSK